jgi:hypothetical protein
MIMREVNKKRFACSDCKSAPWNHSRRADAEYIRADAGYIRATERAAIGESLNGIFEFFEILTQQGFSRISIPQKHRNFTM